MSKVPLSKCCPEDPRSFQGRDLVTSEATRLDGGRSWGGGPELSVEARKVWEKGQDILNGAPRVNSMANTRVQRLERAGEEGRRSPTPQGGAESAVEGQLGAVGSLLRCSKVPPGSQGLNPQPKLLVMMLDQRIPWLQILAFMAAQSSLAQLPQIPPITDPKFIEDCVKIHNELRAIVNPTAGNMKYMTWDASLAKTARAWSKKCVFKHNVHIGKRHACHPLFKTVGENLWMGILTKYVVRNATTDWFNEVKYFEMSDNTCSRVCGHYTQVVWASTYKVGCALKMCPNLGKHVVMFVCNYSPEGNLVGTRPYAKGVSCTYCEEGDTCENNQCNYPYWNPSWEIPRRITCNQFCQICVSFRLVGIVFAITGVYILQKKFPNMQLMA
ncbi:GLIPR1-like protein 1 [Vombatus ursinus]|uniref:GLIPR1-like protein 1 n=1 Tax=Vombatus ursinus TaxID=29139 RepID=UPI000FFD73A5|nr:GLIPR1-like protein 1 [Vombatus ursinus]